MLIHLHTVSLLREDKSVTSDHLEAISSPLALKSSLELLDTDDSESNEPIMQGDVGHYCQTCRSQLHSPISPTNRVEANDGRMIMTRQVWKSALELSPIEILRAGRVDPFLSYPIEKPDRSLHELIDLGKSPDPYVC
jgi:hypothetical protein